MTIFSTPCSILLLCVGKLTDHPDERGNRIPSGPTKIITTQQAAHNTFPFFILRLIDGIQVLNTAMYLNHFYLFFLVKLGWLN